MNLGSQTKSLYTDNDEEEVICDLCWSINQFFAAPRLSVFVWSATVVLVFTILSLLCLDFCLSALVLSVGCQGKFAPVLESPTNTDKYEWVTKWSKQLYISVCVCVIV